MSKAGAGLITPLGFRFDREKSLTENAAAAWEVTCATRRAQAEQTAKVLARRAFKTDEFAFIYESFSPLTPTFVLDDERIAFKDGEFQLVDFCGDCGRQWQLYPFSTIAGLGRVIALRDDEPDPFTCRACEWKAALENKKRPKAT